MLTVLTWNLWNDSGPAPERLALVRDEIDRLDPDLIGFQEIVVGDDRDMLRDVAPSGFHTAFGPATPFWLDPACRFGNAVASRWPISAREVIELPGDEGDEVRVALTVTVDSPHGPIGLTCTHLNYKLHDGHVRERQVAALAEISRSRRPRGGMPPIVVGDFNAEPDSSEIRYMKGLHTIDGGSVQFYDAWDVAGDGGAGTTWGNDNAYAAIAAEPDRRIDYVFVGPPVPAGPRYRVGEIRSCAVIGTRDRDGVWPSDHYGVFATLRTDPVEMPPVMTELIDRMRDVSG